MYHEPNVNVGDITAANPFAGLGSSADSTARDPEAPPPRLDWIGQHAFTARYALQPVVDRVVGVRWGPRHDQSVHHHLASVDSPTGLVYAYDLTWDEYAVLATDVPATAVDAAVSRARAKDDANLTVEVFAGLLADSLPVPTRTAETSTETSIELSTRVEL